MSKVIDYQTATRLFPRNAGETEEDFRKRLTMDGHCRFMLRSAAKNLVTWREVTAGAEATASYVVLLDDPVPQFATEPTYAPPKPVDLVGNDRLPDAASIGEILARSYGSDPRVITCTARERDNPRLMGEINQLARTKGLVVRFSP
jgi:hypothetical protein